MKLINKYNNTGLKNDKGSVFFFVISCHCLQEYLHTFVNSEKDVFYGNQLIHANKLFKRVKELDPGKLKEREEEEWNNSLEQIHSFLNSRKGDNKYKVRVLCSTIIFLLEECLSSLKGVDYQRLQAQYNQDLINKAKTYQDNLKEKLKTCYNRADKRKLQKGKDDFFKKLAKIKKAKTEKIKPLIDLDYTLFQESLACIAADGKDGENLYRLIKNNLYESA